MSIPIFEKDKIILNSETQPFDRLEKKSIVNFIFIYFSGIF